jgi:hypothetical protein
MAYETIENVVAYVKSVAMRIGNSILDGSGVALTSTSVPLYVDSSSKLAAGGFPFPVQFLAGVTSTASAVATIQGQATNTANDLMHLTLVKGANATATVAGYYRVSVTDDAGVITTGDYYAPFYTLA